MKTILQQKSVICNYFFEDGTKFFAPADKYAFAKSASDTFDVEETTMLDYLYKCENKYDLTASLFLENSLSNKSISLIPLLHFQSILFIS